MSQPTELLDLIVQWEDLIASGRPADPEVICRDRPELLEDFKECLRAMKGMNVALKTDETPECGVATQVLIGSPPTATLPVHPDWPRLENYEILEELGRGGMGVVMKARQKSLGRIVAIKTIRAQAAPGKIRDDQRRRFEQEARLMALLQHPHIVQIYEGGEVDGHPFLVMEYVEGQSLSDRLDGKPLPPHKAAELVAVLAEAVDAAHRHGIIHRDLKPNNILLAADGTPKICDFGLAKHFENPVDNTQTGELLGTPSYMAPEQIGGLRDVQKPAVDIYALGAVLYETLTGRPPFLADNPLDTLQMVTRQDPIPPRHLQAKVPRDLETICLKCLEKSSARRYSTAGQLAEDLRRYLAGEPIRARAVSRIERGWRWCVKHPSGAGLTAVATFSLIVVLSLVLVYNRRLADELQRTDAARRQTLSTQENLQQTVTAKVADRLDGDLRELATVPLAVAILLESRADWDAEPLEAALRDMLKRNPLIFGLCVAFEPSEWRKDQADFALYVYRQRGSLAVKQLVPPSYQPHYRQWPWYHAARDSATGIWGEPYIGEGGDGTPMATFSAPIRRHGRFVGVVAADLAMDYFGDLRTGMDRLDLGKGTSCFVVSAASRILAHPLDRYEFPSPESDLNRIPIDASFRNLVAQWSRAPAGTAQAVDFSTGQPSRFLFSRIPATHWTLVVGLALPDGVQQGE